MDEVCKSELCIVCKNFMGFVDGKPMCLITESKRCPHFIYNGKPKPDAPKGCRPTELINEYLLSLSNKSNNRDN